MTETKVTYVDGDTAKPQAMLLIEGMSCERMCVNAVNKSIAAVPGVMSHEILFDADATIDTLYVDYDASKVGETQLIQAVESIAGGDAYHVTEIKLPRSKATSFISRPKSKSSSSKSAEVSSYRFTVPNFLDVFRRVRI